jgi:hypothetical protein
MLCHVVYGSKTGKALAYDAGNLHTYSEAKVCFTYFSMVAVPHKVCVQDLKNSTLLGQ